MRNAIVVVLLVGPACTSTTPEPKSSADVRPSDATPHEDPPPSDTALPSPAGVDCEGMLADYLAARAALSTCAQDSDCAEMWPGLCPHGPYYIDRAADVAPVIAREVAIMKTCSTPECEPPMELGIARCDAGKCVRGRSAPTSKSCWDFRETNLEANGATDAETVAKITGTTPHLVISPAAAGTLALEIDWPPSCTDCKLQISEHNSGMARPVSPAGTSSDVERHGAPIRRQRIELAVKPGPYHMIATSAAPVRYVVRAQLKTESGEIGKVTRHGVGWQRMCED
jgi:hypothetical protein